MAAPPPPTVPSRAPQPTTNPLPSNNPLTPAPNTTSSGIAGSGLRVPSNKKTIYDRNLNRSRNAELSNAAFAYLFMEMVVYAQRRVTGIQDLERRLNQQAHPLGVRLLDLLLYRSLPPSTSSSSSTSQSSAAASARPTRIIPLLQLLTSRLWPLLFTRPASSLEQSTTNPAEYMVIDNDPLVNKYISVPREMSQLNCAAWVAGVVEGVCDASGMSAECSAHTAEGAAGGGGGDGKQKTVILVRFSERTMERERELERAGIK